MKYNDTAYILKNDGWSNDHKIIYIAEKVKAHILSVKINDELIKMFIYKREDGAFILNDFYSGLLISVQTKLKEIMALLNDEDFKQKIYNARLNDSYYKHIEILDGLITA